MSTSKEQTAISKVTSFLQECNHCNKTVSSRMLTVFYPKHWKDLPCVELEFAQVATCQSLPGSVHHLDDSDLQFAN
uniref:Uncharacterized protein n=1 Tax=Hucho hucho TaxID=62062 RepID=A0A4W5LHX8_9TELE